MVASKSRWCPKLKRIKMTPDDSRKLMTPHEFCGKCEWEGDGIWGGFDYGLDADDLDDSDPVFKNWVSRLHKIFVRYKNVEDELNFEDYLYNE